MDIRVNIEQHGASEKPYKIVRAPERQIFRTYDIRGIVDQGLNPDVVYTIGRAIGAKARSLGQTAVSLGRDGRLSSAAYANAMKQGLLESGLNVIDLGLVPTPVVYFATYQLETNSGIMITGSHNPKDYNGIKMVIAGETLRQEAIVELYACIQQGAFVEGQGQCRSLSIIPQYIEFIAKQIQLRRPLQVVVDGGNGAASELAPALLRRLGCKVETLYCEIDGNFPNHHPDPTVPKNLQDLIARVQASGADAGIALDGDGDRVGIVTNKGEIIWPDRLMMLFATDVLQHCPGSVIAFDVKCTSRLAEVIKAAGGVPVMSQTGHSLLKAKMKELKAPLAGELSGHIFFNDARWFGFDDGTYVAVRFLELLAQRQETASEIFAKFPNTINTPELKVYISEEQKESFMKAFIEKADFAEGHKITIDGLRVEYPWGWGLVRASNTTACLTARFEADTDANLTRIRDIFRRQLLRIQPDLVVDFG